MYTVIRNKIKKQQERKEENNKAKTNEIKTGCKNGEEKKKTTFVEGRKNEKKMKKQSHQIKKQHSQYIQTTEEFHIKKLSQRNNSKYSNNIS